MARYEVKLVSCQLDTIEKVSICYYSMWMRKPLSPSELADKFMLRLPDGLRDRIAVAAAINKRSMNSEIVALIERGLENAPFPATGQYEMQKLMEILERISALEKEIKAAR